jgi:hypothetical protein
MSPWDLLLTGLGWLLLALFVLVALAIALLVVGVIVEGLRRKFSKKVPPTVKQDDYMAEATAIARKMALENQLGLTQIDAFRAGARWGWGFFHRK